MEAYTNVPVADTRALPLANSPDPIVETPADERWIVMLGLMSMA